MAGVVLLSLGVLQLLRVLVGTTVRREGETERRATAAQSWQWDDGGGDGGGPSQTSTQSIADKYRQRRGAGADAPLLDEDREITVGRREDRQRVCEQVCLAFACWPP